MGHALGLSHSNNSDGDSNPYDNMWDVMSGNYACPYGGTSCPESFDDCVDPTYFNVPIHMIAYHKQRLGWLSPAEVVTLSNFQPGTLKLIPLSAPGNGVRMIRIPRPDGRLVTVEARANMSGVCIRANVGRWSSTIPILWKASARKRMS